MNDNFDSGICCIVISDTLCNPQVIVSDVQNEGEWFYNHYTIVLACTAGLLK